MHNLQPFSVSINEGEQREFTQLEQATNANTQSQNLKNHENGANGSNLVPAQPNYPFMMLNEPCESFEFVPNSL